MKKILLFLFTSVSAMSCFAQGKSFHEDSRNFDIRLDLAAYSGTAKDNLWQDTSPLQLSGIVLTPQMSWAVSKGLSIGWSAGIMHYLDSGGSSASLNGLDANFIFDIHFLKTPKTDMMLGLKLGVAGIRQDVNDGTGNVYGSLGGTWDIHWMTRFYVSEHLAIIANLGLPGYSFSKFGKNTLETFTIKFKGVCFGTGIAFKLPNQRTTGTQRMR